MKIIVTTSNKYLHLIPVFEFLYRKYWNSSDIEIVGYEKPDTQLPFVSLGVQGDVKEWSTDLRKYFMQQPDSFIWIMEDTILKRVDVERIPKQMPDGVGKICLTNDVSKRDHVRLMSSDIYIKASPTSRYRLSTQPSLWNKEYLLRYLTDGLNPWEFETLDPVNDGWNIYGMVEPCIIHNEGVRRFDPCKVDLTGLPQEDINYIQMIAAKWLK